MNYSVYNKKGKKSKVRGSHSKGMKESHAALELWVADP